MRTETPIDDLLFSSKDHRGQLSEPIYGGYTNARGVVSLIGEDLAYRVDSKRRTIQQKAMMNPDARACYNAVTPGETFVYGGVTFRRLSDAEIAEICASGSFRVGSRSV